MAPRWGLLTSSLAMSSTAYAQQATVEVGKFVNPSTSATSMILALLMVLGLIVICALLLKKFTKTTQNIAGIKVIASTNIGTKERLIVVEVGEKQMLLGVTPQQINLLDTLEKPLEPEASPQFNQSFNQLFQNQLFTKKSSKK